MINRWKHNTEAVTITTEPIDPPAPPVAMVTVDLLLPGTPLQQVEIPLEQFNNKIVNNPAYWTLHNPVE